MKKILVLAVFTLSLGSAFGQDTSAASSALTTLLPSQTATELMNSATATIASPFATTSASVQARGVAGKEQMKDELVALEDDMKSGEVSRISEVRQPALKELFSEISSNEDQMNEINASLSGSELQNIATAVAFELMIQ